ncbi:flagellar biosynthesis anti-sigma factor FlgM [Aliikangiella sp. G2MR2-5]|uniref:flagellar biosynthesis anti-sigma factor FlgM n=1 Tax=Aliikangiella sp. G2MR2-5 TaxID=2788943 RepID=UPI0018A9F800|nr:flagellar biosynthesis anti-sigma factor FlgM [Aliikangiella sp. G2MR2-5]
MVMDIRNLVPGHVKSGLGKTNRTKSRDIADNSSSSSDESDDSVSLTGQTSHLASIIQQMKSSPVVDPDRVSPVKEKVDKGDYEIEYERVANKMLDFESSYYDY